MLPSKTLRPLLLAGICLWACGTPVHLPSVQRIQDGDCSGGCESSLKPQNLRSEHPGVESVTGLLWKAGAGGAAPHAPSTGEPLVTRTENWDGRSHISGSAVADGGAWNNRSEIKEGGTAPQSRDSQRQPSAAPPPLPNLPVTPEQAGGPTARVPFDGILAPSSVLAQMKIAKRASREQGGAEDKEQEPDWTGDPPSSIPPLDFITPQNSAPVWDQYGPTVPALPDPLLPDVGSNLMPKEDGPESVWTEATRVSEAGTGVQPSPDEATEGTMSSEALPLIFEPLEDAVWERGSLRPPADSDGPSRPLAPLVPDGASPRQTSGTERPEPVAFPGPSASPRPAGGAVKMLTLESAASASPVTAHQHEPRSGLEATESEEDPGEEEEEDDSEESLEEESEEDATEAPESPSLRPLVCIFPPPPVWVQRNQGLMRSWLELIREKAGYVSGMLAPVGVGISGALLIVGALYGVRTLHRKRRNNLKRQRKTRQQEQPGESGSGGQDQAMLLADSSEDEF